MGFVEAKTDARTITVAVAGNPNSGKTTIFNNLTGARQKVGNYPGVTVEWKRGTLRRGDLNLDLIDLPGTYSLSPYSEEELVARDYLVNHDPDVIIDVLDAANLERNLFLTTELLEIGRPLIIVLNMIDAAREADLRIDTARLAERLGVPVVATVGNKGEGMDELVEAIVRVASHEQHLPRPANVCRESAPGPASLSMLERALGSPVVDLGAEGEGALATITEAASLSELGRWRAVKLLEQDPRVLEDVPDPAARMAVSAIAAQFNEDLDEDLDTWLARRRYDFIDRICRGVCIAPSHRVVTISDRIDRVVMHPVLGVPIFLAFMFMVFTITFTAGTPLMNLIDQGFGWLGATIDGFWAAGSDSPLRSLLVDGIISGVGGVVVFLPNIVLLFLAIAILESTGYMARAAFVMDRLMSKVGLHGKSFIPLLIGFGCTVPAIMATRTLESRRDRLITIMVLPLMSCGARLPIYALMIPAFFAPRWQGPVLWIIYVTGIVLALLGARLLRATMFRGESTPFLMELPPYRMPTATSLLVQMWTRAWLYVKKAGTVILGAAIILWVLASYPKPPADYMPPQGFDQVSGAGTMAPSVPYGEITDPAQAHAAELAYSVSGRIGRLLEPLIRPMGFDWRLGTALVGATAAKEVFVAQMGVVFAVGEVDETSEDLRHQLRSRYSSLVGFCIMLFALISTPCVATFAITRQEAGRVGWAFAQAWGLTGLAWILTVGVYQIGLLLGYGAGPAAGV